MQYLLFSIGAGAIVLLASKAYKLFERWARRRRLRGAQECLDAVHYTLAGLAECKSGYSESTKTTLP
jgi:peptidoglycan/LPS O-acetylase OafA/YrhL